MCQGAAVTMHSEAIKIKIGRFSMYFPAKSTFVPLYSYQDTFALLPISDQAIGVLLSPLSGCSGKTTLVRLSRKTATHENAKADRS
jgi:hypothetical protein